MNKINDVLFLNRKSLKYGKSVSGFIHNLNTPLMGIQGRVELMKFKNPELKGLDQILKQTEKINEIISSMAWMIELDRDSSERSFLQIDEILNGVNEFLKTNMKYKHRLKVSLPEKTGYICHGNAKYFVNALLEIIFFILENCEENSSLNFYLKEKKENEIQLIINCELEKHVKIGSFKQDDVKNIPESELGLFYAKKYLNIFLLDFDYYAEESSFNFFINLDTENKYFEKSEKITDDDDDANFNDMSSLF